MLFLIYLLCFVSFVYLIYSVYLSYKILLVWYIVYLLFNFLFNIYLDQFMGWWYDRSLVSKYEDELQCLPAEGEESIPVLVVSRYPWDIKTKQKKLNWFPVKLCTFPGHSRKFQFKQNWRFYISLSESSQYVSTSRHSLSRTML